MVTRLGMSKKLGPMVYGQKEELIFLGREISEQTAIIQRSVAEEIVIQKFAVLWPMPMNKPGKSS